MITQHHGQRLPDGDGYALMLINPHSNPNHSQCNNWQESVSVGGNPGFNDTISLSN